MANVVSAVTARTQFARILKRATTNQERFVVARRGEPQVVIMGIDDFIRTMEPPREVLQAIRIRGKRKGTSSLTMREIDAEIFSYRREQRRST